MKALIVYLSFFLTLTSIAGEPPVFSKEWKLKSAIVPSIYKRDGVEYKLRSLVFDKNKTCSWNFFAPDGKKYSRQYRFIVGSEELCLIYGKDLKKASVEIYHWSVKDGVLTLTQKIKAEDIEKPDTKGQDKEVADLLEQLHKNQKDIILTYTFHR